MPELKCNICGNIQEIKMKSVGKFNAKIGILKCNNCKSEQVSII